MVRKFLVESGLVPGTSDNQTSIALADNKRIKSGEVVGTGYYNAWSNLKLSVPQNALHLQDTFQKMK